MPQDLGNWRDRPVLLKTPGATHFLQTDEEIWTEPEPDGLMYLLSLEPSCPTGYGKASAKTFLKYTILKKKLDELNDDRGMYVALKSQPVADTFEVLWPSSNIPPFEELPYNQSVLQNSVLQFDGTGPTMFIMKKENSQIVFKPPGDMEYNTLCYVNIFKLRWA
ncbi:uncharacterized protein LOC125041996 [Penaeus chinensis]|uniref:uncharacterized protein LOC125041996 n=1 Tax=Penaeus chinensis TaxID=139456 RepID=UPI001FB6DBC1|nr:uncharacterized protein LOC125041996 [Penaeus chinensis]